MSEAAASPANMTAAPALGQTFGRYQAQAKSILAQPAVRKSLPAVLVTLAVAALALIYILGRTPEMRTLFSSLPEADKAAVVEALQNANFTASINDATGSIEVPASDFHKARMLLAGQGLPKAAPQGYELLNDMPLGTSRALEQARLKQSQESELARSIAEISTVESARVHLALPEQSVFVRDQTPPTASVFVKLAQGRSLGEAQVRSIVNLVASSIPGMPADRVSVIDQMGTLLTQDGAGDEFGESRRRLGFQSKMEDMYRQRLMALLTPIIGSDNFSAEVHLDLDFTESQQTSEAYDKDNAVIRSEQGTIQADGAALPTPRGVPGALSNIAPPAATVAPTPPTGATPAPGAAPATDAAAAAPAPMGPRNETYTRNYEIGKQVSVTKAPMGELKRVSAAIVLRDAGKGMKAKDIQSIEKLVQSSIGFDAARGDVVTVTARPFTADTQPEKPWYKIDVQESSWIPGAIKIGAALAVFALVFFVVLRPFLNRALAAANEPARPMLGPPIFLNPGEEQAMESIRARLKPRSGLPPELLTTANSYDDKVAVVRMFVSEDTARASNVVRQLLRNETASRND